jgi:carboxypeptidase family protein
MLATYDLDAMLASKRCREIVILYACLLVLPNFRWMRADGQAAEGTVSGTITNQGKLGIPYARVSLQSLATGVGSSVTTGAPGIYSFAGLAPGNYELTVEAPGFTTQGRTTIAVTVGAKPLAECG